MPPQLSEGALKVTFSYNHHSQKQTQIFAQVIMSGGQVDKPIMQVLNSKQVNSNQPDKKRFRLLLSDGLNTISFAMVTTHITEQNTTGEIPDLSIIRMNNYITSVVNNTGRVGERRVLVIISFDILAEGHLSGGKIGSPIALPDTVMQENGAASANGAQKSSNGTASGGSFYGGGGAKPSVATTSADLNETALANALINPISSISPYSNKYGGRCGVIFIK